MERSLSDAVARVTDPRLPADPDERALLVDQDARLLAVLLFEPSPGLVASAQLIGVTFNDGRERRPDTPRDELGRYRKVA